MRTVISTALLPSARTVGNESRNPRGRSASRRRRIRDMNHTAPTTWAKTVAIAAPSTPMSKPNINTGSSTRLIPLTTAATASGVVVS